MPRERERERARAFTLIELAIVLVVIGLIAATVLLGGSLVRQAKLRSVLNDLQKYTVAINLFKGTYDELPGDFSKAALYWSTTTSGDGDGWIGYDVFGASPPSGSAAENIRMWQHLSLAGMIPGSYTGTGSDMNDLQVGVNAPAAAIGNAGFFMENFGTADPGRTGNNLDVGSGTYGCGFVFTPSESYNVDLKIDEGIPRAGRMWICDTPGASRCYNGTLYGAGNSYNVTNTGLLCSWAMVIRFR